MMLEGAQDAEGQPLELVFPTNEFASDIRIYQASAINLLSGLANEDPQTVVQRVQYYERDVLTMSNSREDILPLDKAAAQVVNLKNLVGYGARHEREPHPYYGNHNTPFARRMVQHFQFEHTVRGSFGFMITSRVINQPIVVQTNFFNDSPKDLTELSSVQVPPDERAVMERIVRGLWLVERAAEQMNYELLVQQYASGLNGDMCRVISKMGASDLRPLGYHILWSPKLAPSEDVAAIERVQIGDRGRRILKDAADALKEYKPDPVIIFGNVVGLLSRGNPSGEQVDRSVVVRWANRPEGSRSVDIVVPLNKDAYAIAIEAHRQWTPVQVQGIAAKVGNTWRLSEAKDFRTI